jgi:PilZ domain
MPDHQHRRHVRVLTTREAGVRHVDAATGLPVGDTFSAEVQNMSAGGALLLTQEPLRRGARVHIEIAWTAPPLTASLRGRVVRVAASQARRPGQRRVPTRRLDTPRVAIVRWVLQEAKRTNQMSAPVRS